MAPGSAEEAALVPQAQVYRADHLLDVARRFMPAQDGEPPREGWVRVCAPAGTDAVAYADLADVKGQVAAKRDVVASIAGSSGGDDRSVCGG